jgi:nicotinamidase-related amidase|tara:strand:- start:3770 stop:4312 length:543 start_codon:yes stop_codon:yes gene_type:complete
MRLLPSETLLFVIDVQKKLFSSMFEQKVTKQTICNIIDGAIILGVPIIYTEQYPAGLGSTIKDVDRRIKREPRFEKTTFSCLGDNKIALELKRQKRKQILICGIETHVCVYQTVQDLLSENYQAHVITDAVVSRHKSDHDLGLAKMKSLGAELTSLETVLFELVSDSKHSHFKAISQIIK